MRQNTTTAIVDALPYPALIMDKDYKVLSANSAAQKLLGNEMTGLDFVRVIRQPGALDCLARALKTGELYTCDIILRQMTPRTYRASAAALPDNEGNNAYLLFTLLDISAQIDAEKARSTFVANVSHELRSPLTSLLGIVETLQGPAREDEKARENFLTLMHEEVKRMSRLVGDLLSLSKLESKEHISPRGEVDIPAIIKRVTAMLSESKKDYKDRITINCDLENIKKIAGDRDELTEVFQNLLENALKYSDPGTPVKIEIARQFKKLVVTITDLGEGIDPEHLPRLTERFYRVDKGRSRTMGGTGLGLAITKHILNRHRANMSIQSEVGVGTVVEVTLAYRE